MDDQIEKLEAAAEATAHRLSNIERDVGLLQRDVGLLQRDVGKLQSDVASLQLDVGVIKATGATKSDVAEAKNSIIMWVVTAIFLAQLLPELLKRFGI